MRPRLITAAPLKAAHAYTLPSVGTDLASGYAYNAAASAESWRALTTFLERALQPSWTAIRCGKAALLLNEVNGFSA